MFGKCYNTGLMPMLHGCAFHGCETFTLSTYCVEHELLIRAEIETERAAKIATRDEPTVRDSAGAAQTA